MRKEEEEEWREILRKFVKEWLAEDEKEERRKRMLGLLEAPKVLDMEEEWKNILGKKRRKKMLKKEKCGPVEEEKAKEGQPKRGTKRSREDFEAGYLKLPEESFAKKWISSISPDEQNGRVCEPNDIDFRFVR